MVGSEFGVNNMKGCIHPAWYQWLRLMVKVSVRDIFWHILGHFASSEYHLNTKAYLSIVSDTLYPSCDGCFKQDKASCHKLKSSQTALLNMTMGSLYGLHCQQISIHLWDFVEQQIHIMDVPKANPQHPCDAMISIRTKTSEECFHHLVQLKISKALNPVVARCF